MEITILRTEILIGDDYVAGQVIVKLLPPED